MTANRPPRRRLTTVREVCTEYLQRGIMAKSSNLWAIHTKRVLIEAFMALHGDLPIDEVIPEDLEGWIEQNADKWKSGNTKKRVAQSIKSVFSWAHNKGLTGMHPLKGVSYSPGPRGKPMSGKQFLMLVRASPAHMRRRLYFLWWTGCRPKELCDLEWTMIHPEKGLAILEQHKTAAKTGEPRIICLHDKTMRLLAWILRNRRYAPRAGTPDGLPKYVFPDRFGCGLKRQNFGRSVRRLCRHVGLPESLHLYGCRHAFITRLILSGVPIKTAAQLAGHKSVKTTENYIHLEDHPEHLHDGLKHMMDKERKEGKQ